MDEILKDLNIMGQKILAIANDITTIIMECRHGRYHRRKGSQNKFKKNYSPIHFTDGKKKCQPIINKLNRTTFTGIKSALGLWQPKIKLCLSGY